MGIHSNYEDQYRNSKLISFIHIRQIFTRLVYYYGELQGCRFTNSPVDTVDIMGDIMVFASQHPNLVLCVYVSVCSMVLHYIRVRTYYVSVLQTVPNPSAVI